MSYSVDYVKLYPYGQAFRKEAKALNICIIDIHNQFVEMHKTWKGNQWHEVAVAWNSLIEFFNSTTNFLVEAVPYNIEIDAYNYSVKDHKPLTEPTPTPQDNIPGKLDEDTNNGKVELSDEGAPKENGIKDKIDDYFSKIITLLTKLENTLNETTSIWVSSGANASRRNFSESKAELNKNITQIKTALNDKLKSAMSDYTEAETAAKTTAKHF